MTHHLTIDVPEPLYQTLEKWAAQRGTTPEALVGDWVARRVRELNDDRLMRWAGAIDSEIADVAEHHDEYLGRGLSEESRDDEP